MLKNFRYEFHLQISNRGDMPNTAGLTESLVLPEGNCNVVAGQTAILYEWRHNDGLERQDDEIGNAQSILTIGTYVRYLDKKDYKITLRSSSNTYVIESLDQDPKVVHQDVLREEITPLWGPICKPGLVCQMIPRHLDRYKRSLKAWVDAWVPKGFKGLACIDLEFFPTFASQIEMTDDEAMIHAISFRQFTYAELLGKFMEITNRAVRDERPELYGLGWYGIGGTSPNQLLWKPAFFEDSMRSALRDGLHVRIAGIPMPVFYWRGDVDRQEDRVEAFRLYSQVFTSAWGRNRTAGGFAYIFGGRESGPQKGVYLNSAELKELLSAPMSIGMTKFILWDALESENHRDRVQKWLDEVFVPTLTELGLFRRINNASSNNPVS